MDRHTSAVVQVPLRLTCASDRIATIAGALGFDPADPFAVALHLYSEESEATWWFSRELLADGIHEPTGQGDVQIWPCLDDHGTAVVILELCSPDGQLLVQAPSRTVQRFLDLSIAAVPFGAEEPSAGLDALLDTILGRLS